MIKLIALDMDGTLLNSQKEIPKAHIQAIHQAVEHEVKLVLCTGRPLVGVKPYYEQLGLSGDNEYVIINNGCSTHQTKDWKLVAWKELSVEDILYLDKISKQTPVQLTLFDEERYLVVDEKPSELVTYDASLVFTTPTEISLKEAISGKNIMFQAMFLAQPDELDTFEKQFASQICQHFSGVRSQPVIYEAMPKGTTKATALRELAQRLDIKPQEIMALGDANNDIEMLEFAGFGVAMGNSSDYVKKLADYVTDSNDENGVATAIEKLILNN
ncbi:Cof-type HAD-IIB family hydrolase [Streptococcus anginosus]|uniref:Cof-type HAD-IIB family hydrolase n=1 Tax=Streptococcus anginosus TaxID=1328 RepID=UPI00124929DE|nr:Cof-type HAD-IIB family hydrolase [Streptococcus anginosus]KAA9306855.1 HAD family phosphatase [Streptococcus anginosus]MED5940315.1 Cof-type HAD-IIB family hydrolase [Streptococcus anginosus]MED5942344.1 Cof-type HAD-IIB family hydrolase [Streptococcus anginosus]MED5971247.1 Cof-type HAD-IIB family hydrolase [Streptococcus anginosus]